MHNSITHHLYPGVVTTPSQVSIHHHLPPISCSSSPHSHCTFVCVHGFFSFFLLCSIPPPPTQLPTTAVSLLSTYESFSILLVTLFCPSVDEWVKKLWYIYTIEYCSDVEKRRSSYPSWQHRWAMGAKWNKSVRERQVPYYFTHMWNLMNKMKMSLIADCLLHQKNSGVNIVEYLFDRLHLMCLSR